MRVTPIFDDRKDPSHIIRSRVDRRRNKTPFHLQKQAFPDSGGILVTANRRSGLDRRRPKKFESRLFTYKCSINNVPRTFAFDTLEEAISAAVRDLNEGEVHPRSITDRDGTEIIGPEQIFQEWEKRYLEDSPPL